MSKWADTVGAGFIPGEASGAIPNGSRVEKCNSEIGDRTPDGVQGVVISSLASPIELAKEFDCNYFYWVIWDNDPRPIGVMEKKVRVV